VTKRDGCIKKLQAIYNQRFGTWRVSEVTTTITEASLFTRTAQDAPSACGRVLYFEHLRANRLAMTRLYEPKHSSDAHRVEADMVEADMEYYENIPVFIFIEAMAI
jgi:hypothetical protein